MGLHERITLSLERPVIGFLVFKTVLVCRDLPRNAPLTEALHADHVQP